MVGIAEKLTRRVELPAGGKNWPVLFTHEVLIDLENITGLSILQGGINLLQPSAHVLRAVVYLVLRRAGAQYTLADAGSLLRLGRIASIRRAVIDAWQASMPDPEPERPGKPSPRVDNWIEAYAIARHDLQLSGEEWLSLTPRIVQAISRQHMEQVRQWEYMHSKAIATSANFSFGAPKDPFALDHFMNNPWPVEIEAKPQDPDDVIAIFGAFATPEDRQKTHEALYSKN